jgi:hypothetical protein
VTLAQKDDVINVGWFPFDKGGKSTLERFTELIGCE